MAIQLTTPTHSLVTSIHLYIQNTRIAIAFTPHFRAATARVMLKYCFFRQRSSVDLVSISYCIASEVLNNKNIMIPHGYVTASDKTQEPGRAADQVLAVAAGSERRLDQSVGWVRLHLGLFNIPCSLYIIIILTFPRLRGKLLNFNAWYA